MNPDFVVIKLKSTRWSPSCLARHSLFLERLAELGFLCRIGKSKIERSLVDFGHWTMTAALRTRVIFHIFQNKYISLIADSINCRNCSFSYFPDTESTVYPKKYAHGFVVLCFVVVMQSFIINSHEVFIHIHQGCFAGTGAIVRLPQCQWSKPDGYGEISQCITTTKHSKAKTVCIILGKYCRPTSGMLKVAHCLGALNRNRWTKIGDISHI